MSAITVAQTLIEFDATKVSKFTDAAVPADFHLKELIGATSYTKYKANPTSYTVTSIKQSYNNAENSTLIITEDIRNLGGLIVLTAVGYSGTYEVLNIDILNHTIDISKKFVATITGTFIDKDAQRIEHGEAWLIVYHLTFIAFEMLDKKIYSQMNNLSNANQTNDFASIQSIRSELLKRANFFLRRSGGAF